MTTETTAERTDRRAMLAFIALATELPMPRGVRFHPAGILCLDLDSVAEGLAWSRYLGGTTRTYLNSDGRRHLDEGLIEWHSWTVQLQANEEAASDEALMEETTTALMAAVGAERSENPA